MRNVDHEALTKTPVSSLEVSIEKNAVWGETDPGIGS